MSNQDPAFVKLQSDLDSKYNPQTQQLQVLGDIASMIQELINVSDDTKSNTDQLKALGAVLDDSRQQLVALNRKESPESPDYSTPVVLAVQKLSREITTQLDKIDVRPQVNVPSPQVKVDAPNVSVASPDLKGIEKLLKTDIPKAFEKAIQSIPESPEPDQQPVLDALSGLEDWLKSIDKASRLKPQMPTTLKVVNPDGTPISGGSGGPITNDGSFAKETGGNLDSIKSDLDIIAAKDFATQTTLALIKAKTDNLDVALSTRAVTGLTDTQLRATPVPVSSSSLPLPTGASTSAKQLPDNHNVVVTSVPTTAVVGTFFQATQPVSAATLPLPSGASTAANQATGNSSLSSIDTKLSGTIATSSSTLPQADLPAAPVNNQKTVTTAGTAVQLQTNTLKVGVIVQALSTNTGLIYVGSSSVSAANGFELQPGQATSVGAANTNSIWLDASVNGDKVCWIGS